MIPSNLSIEEHNNVHHPRLDQHLISYTCELVLTHHADVLPDLSKVNILLSNAGLAQQCLQHIVSLAKQLGHAGLLGPHIGTLDTWLELNSSVKQTVISEHARELILVEALSEYPHIYRQGSPWMLAESLMELFDELTQYHVTLPDSLDAFITQIIKAYGQQQSEFSALSKEARLVHTLWTAMHQQFHNNKLIDPRTAYILKLAHSINCIDKNDTLYYCGIPPATPSDRQWQQALLNTNQLHIVSHQSNAIDNIPEQTGFHQYLQTVYSYQQDDFITRTTLCHQQYKNSPIQNNVQVYTASNSEDEARAIDIQVRRWLIDGKQQIGIVTENRKLARRIRALLERANVTLHDNSGWALSTTSAATVIERLLETIEEDFHHIPLLDLLKSPFLQIRQDRDAYLQTVYQFEHGIVIGENIANGLERYRTNIKFRQQRLPPELASQYDAMLDILDHIALASAPLTCLHHEKNQPPSQFINGLLESLRLFKIDRLFEEDEAGRQLLQEIQQIKRAATYSGIIIDWLAFRHWLGRTLERFNFKPGKQAGKVKLITLTNSELYQFDGIIFASAEQGQLPPINKQSPYFNDAVRAALGIPTSQEKSSVYFYYFRRLLASIKPQNAPAGSVLFTRRMREHDEDIVPSPWLEALQSFHRASHGQDLENLALQHYVDNPISQIIKDNTAMPQPKAANPSVSVHRKLLPKVISAGAYQQLMNCPFQFFAARCLRLASPEAVRNLLQKSDYGERVHLCLQAFHSNVRGLPGPADTPLIPENRQAAEALLNQISTIVFSRDIEDNFLHRGWLKQWQAMIPAYIDWQMIQQQRWRVKDVEVDINAVALDTLTKLSGRIDRIDTSHNQDHIALSVIDYKTGRLPSPDDVISGEAVQLPFYLSLLSASGYAPPKSVYNTTEAQHSDTSSPTHTAEYLQISQGKVSAKITLEGEPLLDLAMQSEARLRQIMRDLHNGEHLTAWGDPPTCRHCQMEGLCRKQTWGDTSQ